MPAVRPWPTRCSRTLHLGRRPHPRRPPDGHALFSTRPAACRPGPTRASTSACSPRTPRRTCARTAAASPAAVGRPRERFLYGRQVHGATVRRATEPPGPARPRADEDGQATALDGRAGARVHRRLPAGDAGRRRRRGRAARRLARAGRRDRRRGRGGAARARGARPGHRPARARRARLLLRGRRGGPRALRRVRRAATASNLDLPAVARAQLRGRRACEVHDVGLCTMCEPERFFSHRRSGGSPGARRGSCGARDHRAGPRASAGERRPRARGRSPPPRSEPAATPMPSPYLPPSSTSRSRSSAHSRRPASRSLGENRAQELKAKAEAHPDTFTWHFIGQLQSRKVKQIVPYADADPFGRLRIGAQAARATHHADATKILIEVDVAGEESKAGIPPDELRALPRAAAPSRSRA